MMMILTLTDTESRLSLAMTANETYHFQTTANHHRFIKVWTSIADLPTSKYFVQTFFLKKVWLRNTLPTYDLDICPNFRSFFIWISLLMKSLDDYVLLQVLFQVLITLPLKVLKKSVLKCAFENAFERISKVVNKMSWKNLLKVTFYWYECGLVAMRFMDRYFHLCCQAQFKSI